MFGKGISRSAFSNPPIVFDWCYIGIILNVSEVIHSDFNSWSGGEIPRHCKIKYSCMNFFFNLIVTRK